MKINFVISRLYNHFHFVQNLSEWSKYIRPRENYEWINATGPISVEEKVALESLKILLQKYDYSKNVGNYNNIFEFFAIADELSNYRNDLIKLIGNKDSEVIFNALEMLNVRFEKIWFIQEPKLREKEKLLNDSGKKEEILKDFKVLFNDIDSIENIDIYLIINAKEWSSGGANIGPNRITLECSESINLDDMLNIIWHEISHLLLFSYIKNVYEFVDKEASREFVNETIAHALFGTFGALTSKYFEVPNLPETVKMVNSYVDTASISESGKQFIENLPFGLGPYHLSKFISEKLLKKEAISISEMAEAILDVHNKA